jgi:RNA-directed DNA polymerase
MKKDRFTVKRLDIAHESSLARALGLSLDELLVAASTAKACYSPFPLIPTPRPFARKPPKKARPIDNPLQPLKGIQKQINKALLRPIVLPDHIFGAVRSRSILGNAALHKGASLLVTLDVRQCFPSITNTHVYRVWQDVLGCSPHIASLLTKLTTFSRHLPQGAPTSPLLANLFIWSVDGPIRERCSELGVRYSTWIDDLAFSGAHARDLIQWTADVLRKNGLRLSHKKIRIMGGSETKALTGTRFGSRSVRPPKEICDRARAGIHKLECDLIGSSELKQYCKRLIALIRHIERICPKDAVRLRDSLAPYCGELRQAN